MNKRNSTISISAVLAASFLALHAPVVGAAGNTANADTNASTAQSSDSQRGVPGVDVDIGSNASDRGLPGVEVNVGRDGDQNNLDTRSMGASGDAAVNADGTTTPRPLRADRG